MKYFIALCLLASCAVAVIDGFVLKEDKISSLSSIIDEKKSLVGSAVGAISSLKESALQKKHAVIEGVKEAAKSKLGYIAGIKDSKVAYVKNAVASAYSQVAALEAAKQAFAKNFIASKTALLTNAYSTISTKANGLHQYKLNAKDQAASLISGAASKVHSEISKKKEFISSLKKPVSSGQAVILQPIAENEPIRIQTYVTNEYPVVGRVLVPEIPIQIYEEPSVQIYGPPAQTYGPSIVPV